MFNDIQSLLEYIKLHNYAETRECEFKSGRPWHDLKLKIVKGALALSNIAGGGYIIIGVDENKTNPYEPNGMSKDYSDTYNQDDVSEFVNRYTDPHVDVELRWLSQSSQYYVVIQISQFENEPIICKKGCGNAIVKGRIYCRAHKKVESTSSLSVSEMREIIELAVDIGITKQKGRLKEYGVDLDIDPFKQERGSF